MSKTANDKLLESVIDRMWSVLGQFEYRGLTSYEVARKFGLNDEGARKIEKLWNGPNRF